MIEKPKIDFYFDFLSPYSYLAWQWVRENQEKMEFSFFPVILGQVIHHYETKGPAEIVPKREYLFKHCLRYAKKYGISFVTPKKLPFNSLYGLRMAVKESAGEKQFQVIDQIFQCGWGKGDDIGDPDVLESLLLKAKLPADRLLANVSNPQVRQALKANVKRAQSKGVFGLPCFIVNENGKEGEPDGELFWGNDSIQDLENFISGTDLLDRKRFLDFRSNSLF